MNPMPPCDSSAAWRFSVSYAKAPVWPHIQFFHDPHILLSMLFVFEEGTIS